MTATVRRTARIHEQTMRRALGVVNLVMAVLVTGALVYGIVDRAAQNAFDPSQFFHYFTVQTTLLEIVVLAWGGFLALFRTSAPRFYTVVRACVVSYAVVVGAGYNLLLTNAPTTNGFVPTSTLPGELQHIWVPIFLVVEWFLMPGRAQLRWSVVAVGMAFPTLWVAFTSWRGAAGDGWYPYFFINPSAVGVGGVALYLSAFAGATVATLTLCSAVQRFRAQRS